jgi:3-hydroxyisobutyrate dehydrogenase-like beta-hydroxyacid dehydrogenase
MILGCIEVLAEAQTLSEKAGIGAEVAHNFIKGIISSNLPVKRYRSSVSSTQTSFLSRRMC